jgi:hypothetical protein
MIEQWDDKVKIVKTFETAFQKTEEITVEELYNRLHNDHYGNRTYRTQVTVDLTSNAAKYKTTGITVPSGSVIKYVAYKINTTVVGGSTTVKLGIGLNGGDVDKYGLSADLVAGTQGQVIPAHAVLSGDETIDVDGVVTNGSALGDTNLTAGSVTVAVVYEKPNAL